jgi:YQGE family putative transporter
VDKIVNRIKIELSHFHALGAQGKVLLTSMMLYNIADPLLWTFVSAYLWREYQSIEIVAVYNLAAFLGLPLGYFLNGLLLRRFQHKSLYLFGTVIMGLIVTFLLFINNLPVILIPVFGFAFGVGSGFYWGNKTFLSIYTTNTENRIYFLSLDTVFSNIAKILVPFFIGWFIVFGNSVSLYTEQTAYRLLAVLMMVLLFFCGLIVNSLNVEQKPIRSVRLKNAGKRWNIFRLFTVIAGFYSGIAIFMGVIIVLKFVGNEDSLGSIQSFAAIVSTIAIYVVARKAKVKHRLYLMIAGVSFAILASLTFGLLYSSLGVVLYYIFNAPSMPFRWVSEGPLSYDLIDHEEKKGENHRYSYIVDQEFFMNVGRNISILIFLVSVYFYPDMAIRLILVVVSLLQVARIVIARHLEYSLHHSYTSSHLDPKPLPRVIR